ncbi:hypothetical protein MSG28_007242 [Choristoneura fumiferana]|uniref:Uncharacterized protein n=1 Tax=Choristoneura fumiferana TaxID=7141 RepID=A0ACC0JW29_CHOFU|nr:hypothetical protein MSG28_007242 [Choristoneura fumiferana]
MERRYIDSELRFVRLVFKVFRRDDLLKSYRGGIPYGSMSGNVAEYFKRQAPSNGRSGNLAPFPNADLDFAPIEQWL